ncbi:hypothetical protein [Desulfosediminicola sp.]|uniref:hypothetical protein n=1 Tax=Desulfosediminicola sp. TaxID=2886825 RepID=UPI003AF240AE
MKLLDAQFLETPIFGTRQMRLHVRNLVNSVGRHRVRRLMCNIGPVAFCQKPRTSTGYLAHKKHPCLLRGMQTKRPNQVWCAEITCIHLPRGHLYRVAIMDWHSSAVPGVASLKHHEQ